MVPSTRALNAAGSIVLRPAGPVAAGVVVVAAGAVVAAGVFVAAAVVVGGVVVVGTAVVDGTAVVAEEASSESPPHAARINASTAADAPMRRPPSIDEQQLGPGSETRSALHPWVRCSADPLKRH